jgi:cell division protease FtsH
VLELLQRNRPHLEDLVAALLERETLDEADAYAAAGLTRDSADSENGGPPLRTAPPLIGR